MAPKISSDLFRVCVCRGRRKRSVSPGLTTKPAAKVAKKLADKWAKDGELHLNPAAELTRHFGLGGAYLNGRIYRGQKYEKGHFAYGLPTFKYVAKEGCIHVWQYAFDLRALAPGERVQLVYHYTNELGFRNVANEKLSSAELFASLTDKNAHFGQGLYATQYEPAVWGSKLRILLNNYTRHNPWREDITDEKAEKAQQEWGLDRVSFCIPLIVPKSIAYNFWTRLTPDVQKRTTKEGARIELGMNVHGQKSHEKRDVWVVRVSDEFDTVQNPHASADSITMLLEKAVGNLRVTEGATNDETLAVMDHLASRLRGRAKFEEAERLYQEALKASRQKLGDAHPSTLISIDNLATLFHDMGKLNEAERLYQEALKARR